MPRRPYKDGAPRPTKGELAARVEWVMAMRLKGAEARELLAVVNAGGEPLPAGPGRAWGVVMQTLGDYIRRADKLLQGQLAAERETLIALHGAMRRQLYARALHANQFGEALRALDSEAKLFGLFP